MFLQHGVDVREAIVMVSGLLFWNEIIHPTTDVVYAVMVLQSIHTAVLIEVIEKESVKRIKTGPPVGISGIEILLIHWRIF